MSLVPPVPPQSTRLKRSTVVKWRREAADAYEADLPACAVLDGSRDVLDLCDALLEAWSDYHAHAVAEDAPPPATEGS